MQRTYAVDITFNSRDAADSFNPERTSQVHAKSFTFDCVEHPEFGELGWRLRGQLNADPLGGMAVAHDCLEHFPNGDMGVEDELLALGASFYVRMYTSNMHSLGTNVGADLPDILRHVIHEGMTLRPPPATRKAPCDNDIWDAIKSLTQTCNDDPDLQEFVTSEILAYIRGWLRTGYRRAARRYRGIHREELRAVFHQIERIADIHLRNAEEHISVLIVTIRYSNKHQRRIAADITITERTYHT